MNDELNPESSNLSNEEKEFEQVLRPNVFSDFKGQDKIVDNLEVFIKAAKQREEALDHVLLHGPQDLVKPHFPILLQMNLVLILKQHRVRF